MPPTPAKTETDAEGVDPAPSKMSEPKAAPKREFEVIRDYIGRHDGQLLRWVKGDRITSEVGESQYAKGAPIRPVAPGA